MARCSADDPFWQSFYPPNGWRCRCRVRAVSGDNLKDRGQRVEVSDGKLGTDMKVVSKKTGEMREGGHLQHNRSGDPEEDHRLS